MAILPNKANIGQHFDKSENNPPEGGDPDYEESDSVFEEESESENEAEKTR